MLKIGLKIGSFGFCGFLSVVSSAIFCGIMTQLTLSPAITLSSWQFEHLCYQNPDANFELSSQGVLIMSPPVGFEGGRREFNLAVQFGRWVETDGTGVAFSSQTLFELPNGAKYMPDLAWIRRDRLMLLTLEQRRGFVAIAPDFVVELRSPSDALAPLQEKMLDYLDAGVQLAWLIDPQGRRVEVYGLGADRLVLENPDSVRGDPLLLGFTLDLKPLFSSGV